VLSDYSLPQFSAPAALRLLQEAETDIPFLIVSGTIGEEAAVEALRLGADDFISKGHWARLVPAIERELAEAQNRRRRRKPIEHWRARSTTWPRRMTPPLRVGRRPSSCAMRRHKGTAIASPGSLCGWRNSLG